MKTKILTICLLLFTSQVFAMEIGIKCKNPNGGYNLWKYIENSTQKKIKIKNYENKWVEWKTKVTWQDSKIISEKFVDIGDRAVNIRIIRYNKEKISSEIFYSVDFEIPEENFTNRLSPQYDSTVECEFLRR